MSFPLVGNTKTALAVTNALKENRLPHAILIEGDSGTGKHTLAEFLSAAAVCSNDNIPCGECKNCSLQKANSHPDITVTAPEEGKKNIAVSQIRALKNEAYIKPHMASCRVFIIDCADTMNEQSQNALLKVLEEPPGNAVFLLIAESKASLLETIISRCVVLTLSCPETNVALAHIKSITEYSENDILSALATSQNNIGKALNILKGESDTKTSAAAKEFLDQMKRGNGWGMLSVTAPFEKSRIEADRFFKDLKYHTAKQLRNNPKSFNAVSFSKFYNELCSLEKSLASNINLSLLFSILTAKATEIFK